MERKELIRLMMELNSVQAVADRVGLDYDYVYQEILEGSKEEHEKKEKNKTKPVYVPHPRKDCPPWSKEKMERYKQSCIEENALMLKAKDKKRIRKRDNYTCQTCGKKEPNPGRRFDVHHILGGWEARIKDVIDNSPGNLLLMCHKCHISIGHCGCPAIQDALWKIAAENEERFAKESTQVDTIKVSA